MAAVLEWTDICVSFGEKQVLNGCSFRGGENGNRIALMGPSGCGKTTLLRVLLSLQDPDSGSFHTDAARISAVFQEPRLLPWLTAAENVNLVLSDSPASLPDAKVWLDRLELSDAADLYPAELSGGMKQRVAIARALAVAPDFLILDEPFRGLDHDLYLHVVECIRALPMKTDILLATHREEEATALGCTILRCRSGNFVEEQADGIANT